MNAETKSFDCSHVEKRSLQYRDGNLVKKLEIEIQPISDDVAIRYLKKLPTRLKESDGENGKLMEFAESGEAVEFLIEKIAPGIKDAANSIKRQVLAMTALKLEVDVPVFEKPEDAKAEYANKTVVDVKSFQDGASVETRLIFRRMTGEEKRRFDKAVGRTGISQHKKAQQTLIYDDIDAIAEMIRGNERKGIAPLFDSAEGYSGQPPFLHLYYALKEAANDEVEETGKLLSLELN